MIQQAGSSRGGLVRQRLTCSVMQGKASPEPGLLNQRFVKAVGHPLRQRILIELGDEPASPSQLSVRLDEPLGKVSYHVKILAECGAVDLTHTEQVRGTVEHFYRASARPRLDEQEWMQLHPATRRALFDATLGQIWDHVVAAGRAGGFEDPGTTVEWTWLELDDQAYSEMMEELDALTDRALALQAQAASRLEKQPGEQQAPHSTELALMHFHR
jgi:DNA-binding transcriptional ArsR family regulator